MAKFEEIKRAAQNAAYTATEKAQGMAAAAGEKASAVKEVAKTNISLVTEKRNLEKAYQALGEWFAAQCGCDDVPEGAAEMLAEIRALEDKLETLKTMKTEQDMSARELLDRGVGFISEKAEGLVALAKKPFEGRGAQEAAEEVAEKAEELAEGAKAAVCEAACEAKEAAEEAKEAVEEAAEEIAEKAEELIEGEKPEE